MDDGGVPGRLLIIGGAEDRCCGSGVLGRFAQMCGGADARVVVITTATGMPGRVLAEYEQARLQTLAGSRINERLTARLGTGLVIAGTSAGATALGRTMILRGNGAEVSTAEVRTAPGLGLMCRARPSGRPMRGTETGGSPL